MAMIARPPLAAAVSNAGGLGMIGCDVSPPDILRAMIRETRALTARAFGVDLIGGFLADDHIAVLAGERVPLAVFFWTPPTPAQLRRLRAAGTKVWMQVGSVAEAAEAVALGIDGLVVQGAEAGGHNRSEASTMTLVPRVRSFYPELPPVAAGGIADGRSQARLADDLGGIANTPRSRLPDLLPWNWASPSRRLSRRHRGFPERYDQVVIRLRKLAARVEVGASPRRLGGRAAARAGGAGCAWAPKEKARRPGETQRRCLGVGNSERSTYR
jgi:hypothetical protein